MKTAVAEVPDFFEVYNKIMASTPFRPQGWRTGQYVFNALHGFRPDVANKIRTTLLDPFHWDVPTWRERQGQFWDRVIDLWEE